MYMFIPSRAPISMNKTTHKRMTSVGPIFILFSPPPLLSPARALASFSLRGHAPTTEQPLILHTCAPPSTSMEMEVLSCALVVHTPLCAFDFSSRLPFAALEQEMQMEGALREKNESFFLLSLSLESRESRVMRLMTDMKNDGSSRAEWLDFARKRKRPSLPHPSITLSSGTAVLLSFFPPL